MAATAPQEVAVVATSNMLLPARPKRSSLPSRLPPMTPSFMSMGVEANSLQWSTPKATTKRKSITPRSARP